MINLFNINDYDISTSSFDNWLNGSVVTKFEEAIASYVGAKYVCSFNSASSAIFLSLLNKNITVNIPSMLPPVVANMILKTLIHAKYQILILSRIIVKRITIFY